MTDLSLHSAYLLPGHTSILLDFASKIFLDGASHVLGTLLLTYRAGLCVRNSTWNDNDQVSWHWSSLLTCAMERQDRGFNRPPNRSSNSLKASWEGLSASCSFRSCFLTQQKGKKKKKKKNKKGMPQPDVFPAISEHSAYIKKDSLGEFPELELTGPQREDRSWRHHFIDIHSGDSKDEPFYLHLQQHRCVNVCHSPSCILVIRRYLPIYT